ncbi:aldehyde dehydrogenase family 9 member A1-A [Lingula anatina]|uniref:Aldehyde dehydrogenase family 9 member A1-A n=1 Tax=Lingula anatina TaxID=7574 RepID=A0A1S3JP79_LINAN|nr:aldehyde dehydrogenase family 9 member A1-A [Lingula anatina]XP_013411804.1 aldehyde dehydrogenase family 9 member A1-A [Lingula anatina]|eukprot:XP_013411803.1 aldehyde dehydrogenase family 9 member A1-A [Lingula anatina]
MLRTLCVRPAGVQAVLLRRWTHNIPAIDQPLNFINGERVEAANTDKTQEFELVEPATGKVLRKVQSAGKGDVNRAVAAAREAFDVWSDMSGMERGKLMTKAAQIVKENEDDFVKAEVIDTGKPIWEARYDIQGCTETIEYFAGVAPTIMGTHLPLPGGSFAYTRREPLGVCGGIGAWNYPYQMAAWKSAPALACGNTMVFKPSQLTPITAVMLAEAYVQAGVPKGVFNVIQGEAETGTLLNLHPDIAKMSFTGSVPTGAKIMANCAKGIKQVTLELGGKSPLIIFGDADLENAAKGAILANFMTQGQVCSNGTRVFVHTSVLPQFLDILLEKTKRMKIGDPFQEDTMVGATISKAHAEKVLGYIEIAKNEGAEILYGGERVIPDDPKLAGGYYLGPCILVGCHDDMTVVKEEVFGSVMSVLPFDTEEEVIRRANNTCFGLAGGVFTKDLSRAHKVVSKLQAGSIYVNNYNVYPVGVPFGGHKMSGIGSENSLESVNHYTQVKSVYVEANDVDCPY